MATYLITGGAGFIGSHLVEALVRRGERVRVLDNLVTGRWENLAAVKAEIEPIDGDVRDASGVGRAVAGCDVVFHQAALASVPRSIEDPLATHAACATGTLVVLDQARRSGVRRVVYAASSSAYGNQGTLTPALSQRERENALTSTLSEREKYAKRESDLPLPLSPYAAAKLAGEDYCQAFWHSYGLETVALRYFNVFGPRQDPNGPYAAVIPLFIKALLAGKQPTIFGDGLQTRDFTYVENVVEANLLAAQAQGAAGQVFNIGSGESISVLDLLRELNAILGTDIKPSYQPERAGDVRDSLADISRARQALGYEPALGLAEGLRRTVEYYQTDGL